MKGIIVVLKKEVRENLRDRKAVFNSLLLAPILFPVLLIGMTWLGTSAQTERAERVLEVPVVGAEQAPNLILYLEKHGMVVKPAPDNPESLVKSQKEPVIIRIPETFGEQWQAGRPAEIEVIIDSSRPESDIPTSRVKGLLSGYGSEIGMLRLQMRGVSPIVMSPLLIRDIDLSTPQSRGMIFMLFLPYILMITAFMGGMHLAIDTTAGEKERRSLEPLLINPVPRWQIMMGKLIATAIFGMASLVLTLIAFRITLPYLPLAALGVDLGLDILAMVGILLVVAPVALMAAALLTVLATYAKSFREAQSYMGLVILIPMIPTLMFMSDPVKPEASMMPIPLFSQNLLIGELVRGETVPVQWLLYSAAGTLIFAFALIAFAATLFSRPRVVFSDA
ncbi:MAG TPA: ABC transporter permease [Halieaceae bacterium]|nr:ABC transporter permease [Halieaceae bacterium]